MAESEGLVITPAEVLGWSYRRIFGTPGEGLIRTAFGLF